LQKSARLSWQLHLRRHPLRWREAAVAGAMEAEGAVVAVASMVEALAVAAVLASREVASAGADFMEADFTEAASVVVATVRESRPA
jgi:hypothetical protein